MPDYCVVGSGPAGVACARALLDSGANVTMLDAGLELEPHRQELVDKLSGSGPELWSAADLANYQSGMNPDVGGVPLKLVFGSDFAYRDAVEALGVEFDEVGVRPSFARGGLSNVWGAAMMPYAAADMHGWPLDVDVLAPHYTAVLGLTGLAAKADDLATRFPLFTQDLTQLSLSEQSQHVLRTMERHREVLNRAGIEFGRSRLAVQGNRPDQDGGCVSCRLCMYGCPYDYIYSSAHTLRRLLEHPRFSYRSGVVVTATREMEGSIEISGHRLETHELLTWRADRAFLAAGAIPTTQILLRSLDAYDRWVTLKDSQYFLLPLLTRRTRGAAVAPSFSLAQLFIELSDPETRGNSAHVQVYSNSDLINDAIANTFGRFARPLGPAVRQLQERLMIAQGFLHSDSSSRIGVRLQRSEQGSPDRLQVRGEINPTTAGAVRAVVRKLARHSRRLGALPVFPALNIAEPGRSFHCGGSFPMSATPVGFETDLLGRPPGWSRVHAVDATVFPSIPATTITMSAMANAHRIGSEAARLDGTA